MKIIVVCTNVSLGFIAKKRGLSSTGQKKKRIRLAFVLEFDRMPWSNDLFHSPKLYQRKRAHRKTCLKLSN